MSHRMDTDMIHRLTRSSSELREVTEKTKIPDFVQKIFDVGEEYGIMLKNVIRYYESVSGRFETIDAPMLIRNIIADAKTDATQQMIRVSSVPPLINVQIDHNVPVSEMIGDGPVIKECLQELIFNGLRHDNNTSVSVYVSAMSHDPCHVTFTVENRGVRISDEDLCNIFSPFHTIHRGIVHGTGLGIGLARCKRMAHELGGDIHLDNGEVTVFSMTLPIRHEKTIRFHHQGTTFSYGKRGSASLTDADVEVEEESSIFKADKMCSTATRPSVLVVDDSVIARRQFERMMRHVDLDVDLCESSSDCLEMIKAKVYNLICLDIIMPVMSGVTCAHHIREGDTVNKNCPIVIITADNSVETRKLCACISNSTVLEKPARRHVLLRTIMSSLQHLPHKEWVRKTWHEKKTISPENIRARMTFES